MRIRTLSGRSCSRAAACLLCRLGLRRRASLLCSRVKSCHPVVVCRCRGPGRRRPVALVFSISTRRRWVLTMLTVASLLSDFFGTGRAWLRVGRSRCRSRIRPRDGRDGRCFTGKSLSRLRVLRLIIENTHDIRSLCWYMARRLRCWRHARSRNIFNGGQNRSGRVGHAHRLTWEWIELPLAERIAMCRSNVELLSGYLGGRSRLV